MFSCLPHWWRTNIDLIYIDHSVWKTSQGSPGYDLTFPLCQQNILIWLCLWRSRINADTCSLCNTLSFPFDFVFIHCTWTSLTVAIIIIWPIQYKQKHLTRFYPLNSKTEKKHFFQLFLMPMNNNQQYDTTKHTTFCWCKYCKFTHCQNLLSYTVFICAYLP